MTKTLISAATAFFGATNFLVVYIQRNFSYPLQKSFFPASSPPTT
jgi:hypothetical protein